METKALIEAVTKRQTVEAASVRDNVLVVTFKPARQFSAKCVCERLERKGFRAAVKGRVLGVKVPAEQERQQLLLQILAPASRNGVGEAAAAVISALAD